jgi:ABC-type multidrug transport system permease subunit
MGTGQGGMMGGNWGWGMGYGWGFGIIIAILVIFGIVYMMKRK